MPDDWTNAHARGYEIMTDSNGFVSVLGTTIYGHPENWSEAPRGSEVECTLDMDEHTMSFTVNDSVPCVAFRDIVPPVRPIVWNGRATLLRVRAMAAGIGVCARQARL